MNLKILMLTVIFVLSLLFPAISKASDEALEEAIQTNIIDKYGFDEGNDTIEKFSGDFDKDGREEVIVVLRKIFFKEDWMAYKESIKFFIFEKVGSEYRLTFQKELPSGNPFKDIDLLKNNLAEIKIVHKGARAFVGFNILLSMGGDSKLHELYIYTYNNSKRKYEEVFWSKQKINYMSQLADFYEENGEIWATVTGRKYYPDTKFYTEYFFWNGEKFIYSHDEKYK